MRRQERAQRERCTERLRDFCYSEFSVELGIQSSRHNPNPIKSNGRLTYKKPGFGNFCLLCSNLSDLFTATCVLMTLSEENYTCDCVRLLVKSQLSPSVSELQNRG